MSIRDGYFLLLPSSTNGINGFSFFPLNIYTAYLTFYNVSKNVIYHKRIVIIIIIAIRAEPYDPYIPNATTGNSSKQPQETPKTARVQQQVDEVVGIMQENIDKVMQRGERLDDLRGKTGII